MILFLDIDGVMVHGNPSQKVAIEADGFYRFSQAAVDAINLLLDKSNIIITLTTSHRFRYNEEEWKTIFLKRGIVTEQLLRIENETPFGESRRETLLKWFTQNNLLPNEVVIIDDDKSLNGLPQPFKERLILTNPFTGLIPENIINIDL